MPGPADRVLVPPPADRPCWIGDAGCRGGLVYLGWGKRYYAKSPVPITAHPGWAYLAILRGRPTLTLPGSTMQLRPGSIFIVHPDCASGWADRVGACCEILSWIWHAPPHESLRLPAGSMRLGSAPFAVVERLRSLHEECRREVSQGDDASDAALQGIRLMLDAIYTRRTGAQSLEADESAGQLAIITNWLARNLAAHHPVPALAEYLSVSRATLYRIFTQHFSCAPAEHLSRLRMEAAKRLLVGERRSVKDVAVRLGFRSADELSRTFRARYGHSISEARSSGSGRAGAPLIEAGHANRSPRHQKQL